MRHVGLPVLVLMMAMVGAPATLLAQAGGAATPVQTVTADGLEVALLSFDQVSSGSVRTGGNCPPGGMAAYVQATLGADRTLITAKVRVRILPSYKGAKVAKVVVEDDQKQSHETLTGLGDFGNPGKNRVYECSLQFVFPKEATYRTLHVGNAVLDLGKRK